LLECQNFLQDCSLCLSILHNYFDSPTKLFSDLIKFLDFQQIVLCVCVCVTRETKQNRTLQCNEYKDYFRIGLLSGYKFYNINFNPQTLLKNKCDMRIYRIF